MLVVKRSCEVGYAREVWGGVVSWLGDVRNQFGIKLAVAGGLALYLSEVLALATPIWSVTTVVVLMLPVYLGAIAEKGLFRAIGTVLGGFAATILVGNLFDELFLFLASAGAVLFVCIYFYGGTRAPYAFFLAGMTMVIVMTRGLAEPERVLFIAFDRVEEILLGIFCSMVVSGVLWPRYARWDFLELAQGMFRELAVLGEKVFAGEGKEFLVKWEEAASRRGGKMRDLIKLGGRESPYFRAHVESYTKMVGVQGMLAQNFADLVTVLSLHPFFAVFLQEKWKGFGEAVRSSLELLGRDPTREEWEKSRKRLRAEWEEIRKALVEVQREKMEGKEEVLRLMPLSISYVMLEEMVLQIEAAADLLFNLPHEMQGVGGKKGGGGKIGRFWVWNGLRGAACCLSALVFCDWIQPPGATLIPIYALLFTVVSRSYVGARGDIGVFTNWIRTGVWGIPWGIGMLLIAPALTNYFWMNLFLGGVLFALGRVLYDGSPGMTYQGNLLINVVVSSLSLNFQEAVSFYDVASCYIGTMIGLGFAAVFQRMVWPVLPQREFRDSLVVCLEKCRSLLGEVGGEKTLEGIRLELILLVGEVQRWSSVLLPPDFGEAEVGRRKEAVQKLARFAKSVWKTQLFLRHFSLVPEAEEKLGEGLKELREEVARECGKVGDSVIRGEWNVDEEKSLGLGKELLKRLGELPYGETWQKYPSDRVAHGLALVAMHRFLAIRFQEMVELLSGLDWEMYEQDRVL